MVGLIFFPPNGPMIRASLEVIVQREWSQGQNSVFQILLVNDKALFKTAGDRHI